MSVSAARGQKMPFVDGHELKRAQLAFDYFDAQMLAEVGHLPAIQLELPGQLPGGNTRDLFAAGRRFNGPLHIQV